MSAEPQFFVSGDLRRHQRHAAGLAERDQEYLDHVGADDFELRRARRSRVTATTSLGPQIQFWQGLPNRWVIRGGAGPTVPLSATGLHTTFDTNLTIGRFLTLDEVRYFKEFTVWLAANNSAVMDHHGRATDTMTILPGFRFRLTPTNWFLYGVEIPLVAPRSEDYGMYVRFVKRY